MCRATRRSTSAPTPSPSARRSTRWPLLGLTSAPRHTCRTVGAPAPAAVGSVVVSRGRRCCGHGNCRHGNARSARSARPGAAPMTHPRAGPGAPLPRRVREGGGAAPCFAAPRPPSPPPPLRQRQMWPHLHSGLLLLALRVRVRGQPPARGRLLAPARHRRRAVPDRAPVLEGAPSWWGAPPALSDDTAPCARRVPPRAPAAPSHPRSAAKAACKPALASGARRRPPRACGSSPFHRQEFIALIEWMLTVDPQKRPHVKDVLGRVQGMLGGAGAV